MTATKKQKKNKTPQTAIPNPPQKSTGFSFPSKYEWLGALAICLATVFFFFSEQILEKEFFWSNYWSDVFEQYVPFFTFNAQAFHAGELPYWNPYCFGGTLHISDPVTQFWYPVHLLLYPFLDGEGDYFYLLSMVIVAHYALFFYGVYYLGRVFQLSFWASIISAIALTFSCVLICRWQFYPVLYTLTWYPFIIAAFEKIHKTGKWHLAFLAALLLVTAFYAGHTQYFFYLIILLAIQALVNLIHTLKAKEGWAPTLRHAAMYFVPVAITLAVGSAQLAITTESIPYTQRQEITYKYASDGSLQAKQLLTAVHPKLFGWFKGNEPIKYKFLASDKVYHYWETAFYFGGTTLLLGFIGFLLGWRKRWVQWLIAISLFGLLHAFGSNGFLFEILFNLPGFDLFRIPARTMLFVVLAFALLAGLAFDRLPELRGNTKKILIAFGIPVLILFIFISQSAGSSFIETYEIPKEFSKLVKGFSKSGSLILFISIALVACIIWLQSIPKYIYGVLASLLIYVSLVSVNKDYKNSKTNPANMLTEEKKSMAALDDQNKDFPRYRFETAEKKYRPIRRNHGVLFKTYNTDGFYALPMKHSKPKGLDHRKAMQISTMIRLSRNENGQPIGYQLEKLDVVPYARMVYNTEVWDHSRDYTRTDITQTVLVDSSYTQPLKGDSTLVGDVQMTQDGYSAQEFTVNSPAEGMLTLGKYWYPAWKAEVDGIPTPVNKVNGCQQGIVIPSGKHTVRLFFQSDSLARYKWLALGTLTLTTLAFVGFRWKNA